MFTCFVVMGLFKMHISLLKVVISIIDIIFIFMIDFFAVLLFFFGGGGISFLLISLLSTYYSLLSVHIISYVEHVINILSQHTLVNKLLKNSTT